MAISENDRRDAYLSRIQVPALDVDGFAAMLRRRAAFIGAVTAICATLSLAWILLSAPRYAASGQILLGLPAQATADAGKPEAAAAGTDSEIGALTSRSVLDKVIARQKLDTDPLFGGKSKGILFTLLAGVGLVPATEPHIVALRQLNRAISIVRNPTSNTVNINVVTPDRETSARIANAVMDSYMEEQERAGAEAASGAVAPFAGRLETLQTRLLEAEQRYERYRSDSRAMMAGGQSGAEKQVSEISDQIATAEAKGGGLRATLNQIQRARRILDSGGIPDTIRGGAIGIFRTRYAAARQLEIDLSDTLGPRHPDRVIARMRAAEAKRLLERSIQDVTQSVTAELERTRGVLTQLKSRLEASRQNLIKTNEVIARLKELEREVEANRAAYQAILVRSQQQQPDNASPRILSRATVPLVSGRTFPVGVLLVSVLLGLGLGVSLAWLLELMNEQKRAGALR